MNYEKGSVRRTLLIILIVFICLIGYFALGPKGGKGEILVLILLLYIPMRIIYSSVNYIRKVKDKDQIKDKQNRKDILLFFVIWLITTAAIFILFISKSKPMVEIILKSLFGGLLFSAPIMLVVMLVIVVIRYIRGKGN